MSQTLSPDQTALLANLETETSAMLKTTVDLCEINSGSYHLSGIQKVQKKLHELFSPLSETHSTIALTPLEKLNDAGELEQIPLAPMQIFSARPDAPLQILCTGHSDTVFPEDTVFKNTCIDGNTLYGPGTADMKGGLVVLAHALAALNNSPFKAQFGFTVAISPDEEIGSPRSGPELSKLAQGKHFGLTFEPAFSDGTLAGARKGSGNFHLLAKGKSAHAGREFFQGKNAVLAISLAAVKLANLSCKESGITVNVAAIKGGEALNVVPDTCVCRFNVRMENNEQMQQVEQNIQDILKDIEQQTGCELTLHGNFNRPPKPMTEQMQNMFNLLKLCGEQMGLDIQWQATGGCCEGNNLAAAGLVNIDTLGVRGAHIHSHKEFALIDSFVERAKLSALLITHLIQYNSVNSKEASC